MHYISERFCAQTLKSLIQVNSCQPTGNELDVVKEILSFFPQDIEYEVILHAENRASLVVKISGEESKGGIAFVGHIDTVPVGYIEKWTIDPLAGVEKNGFIYGRGTADMKGGVVSMIATALTLLKEAKKPKEPIYFCFTADEEASGMGALALVQNNILEHVREVIIAEPSNEELAICEKGALWLKVCAKGKQAHGSRPEVGINAIENLMKLHSLLNSYMSQGITDKYLGVDTMSITKLSGGTMTNVIPSYAEMELDIRTLPMTKHEDILAYLDTAILSLKQESLGLDFDIHILNNRPAVATSEQDPLVLGFESILKSQEKKVNKIGLYFYTDASQIIPALNIPFIIYGPGDDLQAHQDNEYIEIKSMVRVANNYAEYLKTTYYSCQHGKKI